MVLVVFREFSLFRRCVGGGDDTGDGKVVYNVMISGLN